MKNDIVVNVPPKRVRKAVILIEPEAPTPPPADEFMRLVGIIREQFKREEIEVSDYVIGRMAILFRSEIANAVEAERKRIRKAESDAFRYLNKWIKKLEQEATEAQGYTRGEKQVVLMNLRKISVEAKVARLVLKDSLTTLQKEDHDA